MQRAVPPFCDGERKVVCVWVSNDLDMESEDPILVFGPFFFSFSLFTY